MCNYEYRISKLESEIEGKCNVTDVRNIIKEELDKNTSTTDTASLPMGTSGNGKQPETVNNVLSEINERKLRESNIVIHGMAELVSDSDEERKAHDLDKIKNILNVCEVPSEGEDVGSGIIKHTRLGRFNKENPKRPRVVTMRNVETKKQ